MHITKKYDILYIVILFVLQYILDTFFCSTQNYELDRLITILYWIC